MHVRQHARSIVPGAVLVAAMAMGLTGCSGESDDQPITPAAPTSQEASASPTAQEISPEEQAKEEKLASAVERYEEYFDVTAKYAQRGENGFKPLLNQGFYGSQDTMDDEASFWSTLTGENLKQTGKQRVIDAELVEIHGDPLASIAENRLVMDVCVDFSQFDVVRADGSSAVSGPGQERTMLRVTMQGQGRGEDQESYWSLAGGESTKEKC